MDALGRFRLRREIGSGPYATVYEAHDGREPCALKVLNGDAEPGEAGARQGLVNALAGLRAISHPSIVKVIDAGEEDGRLFVEMELMQCPTLEQKLAECSKLDESQAVLFVRQAAQALDRARDAGYFHGNLSPANVFVVSDEKIKVSDFGIDAFIENPPAPSTYEVETLDTDADEGDEDDWVTAQELMRRRGVLGTNEMLDEDFSALALLMLRMLGKETPPRLDDESVDAYRERLRRASWEALSAQDSGVSVHTAEVIRRLLSPGEFGSAGEVVVELASAMLLRRSYARNIAEEDTQMAAPMSLDPSEGIELEVEPAEVVTEAQEEIIAEPIADVVQEGLVALQFKGNPLEAAYTPFFAWDGRRSGKFFVIYEGERLTIGRDPEFSEITLVDPAISRRHCVLSKEGGVLRIEDLGSSNGTFVNEQRITSSEIRLTDKLRIGATRVFTSLVARE